MSLAHSIFHRMSHIEKLDVNSASHDRLAWLGQNHFRGDMILHEVLDTDREAVMFEVQGLVIAEHLIVVEKHLSQINEQLTQAVL